MMWRTLVLVLSLLNLGYLAWAQGWLLPYGLGPATQQEPQRLARQLHPEAIRVVVTQDSPGQAASAPSQLECLQSEVLDARQADQVRTVLQSTLSAKAWTLEQVALPPRWLVYMGRYNNPADAEKKRTELARLGVVAQAVGNPDLAPGLDLGAFESQAQAEAALKTLTERGVRTARVVQESAQGAAYRLRLPAVAPSMKAQLAPVQSALPGQALQPCNVLSAPD
jgi:cell division protein FtsN